MGIPVGQREPPALVAEDTAENRRFAVAAVDDLRLAFQYLHLDSDAAVTGREVLQRGAAAHIVVDVERLVDDFGVGASPRFSSGWPSHSRTPALPSWTVSPGSRRPRACHAV